MSVSSISMLDEFDSSSFFIDVDGNDYSTQSMRFEEEEEDEVDKEECRKYAIAEIATTYTHIKNMNNVSATSLIRKGKYDKAIVKLEKALKILRPTDDININYFEAETCKSHCCSLDGCIEYSEKRMNRKSANNRMNKLVHMIKEVRRMTEKKTQNMKKYNKRKEDDNDRDSVHRTPICIPNISIGENHNMGSTLFLIITFNLTLAHHLKVLEKQIQKQKQKKPLNDISTSLLILIKGTIQLYKILLKSIERNNTDSLNDKNKERFINIVQNNMNHLIKNENTVSAASTKEQSDSIDNLSFHSEKHAKASPMYRRPSTTDSLIASISRKENNENFSSWIQSAIKTSFSFIQLQHKTIRCATAA